MLLIIIKQGKYTQASLITEEQTSLIIVLFVYSPVPSKHL